jgi:hypothetical protein
MVRDLPETVRPDLIGKTVVFIVDPRSYREGRTRPRAILGEIVAAGEDSGVVRCLGTTSGLCKIDDFDVRMPIDSDYELLEPGERLEQYLPGYGSVFGTPDYVYFQGSNREKWLRARDIPTAS